MFTSTIPLLGSSDTWAGFPAGSFNRCLVPVTASDGTEYFYYLQRDTTASPGEYLAMRFIPRDGTGASGEQDQAGHPEVPVVVSGGWDVEMDALGVIHIAFLENNAGAGGVRYCAFDTVTNLWGSVETVSSTVPTSSTSSHISITVDGANKPHIVWKDSTSTDIMYSNRVAGTWAAEVSTGAIAAARTRLQAQDVVDLADNLRARVYAYRQVAIGK